ncbi:glucosidase [bacterium]|nr:MAG: glucosidase [bacterium]
MLAEHKRLRNAKKGTEQWKKWGPYLAERAWGTVREDYSNSGAAWDAMPHDHARSKAYRWNEDGLAGWCDGDQNLCFALALWNGRDPILKERLFGLSGTEGKHGEDVKELLYFMDALPSHAMNRALYKYPQAAYPYQQLLDGNAARTKADPEYELLDTGVFEGDRYFDIEIEYIKAAPEDTLIQITAHNRGPDAAPLHLVPTLWFRNTWTWKGVAKPGIALEADTQYLTFRATKAGFGSYYLLCEGAPETLFCNNETNAQKLYGSPNPAAYVKDGIGRFIVEGDRSAVNPRSVGTKAAAHYTLNVEAGQSACIRLRLCAEAHMSEPFGDAFEEIYELRKSEADEFFATLASEKVDADQKLVQRQALAGLLWGKQYYNFNVLKWLRGDPTQIEPPEERWYGRDHNWTHLNASSVMSMPDAWEYPWFAAWDLAFHCVTFAIIDPEFAKDQLTLLLREWMMHPNGQLPAYEWAFGDVNPPVHAWAALRVYRIEKKRTGTGDMDFLESTFHKLLLNFTWWVNRKDAQDRNVFQGGFLGLDNIGIFDRSAPLPGGAILDQADGTAWMAMYCLNMLAMALELAAEDPTYEDMATKFLEHFFYIAHAMNDRFTVLREPGIDLWDEQDGFYYDVLQIPGQSPQFLRARSMVGLLPLLAVETLEDEVLNKLPEFKARMDWFLEHRPDLTRSAASISQKGQGARRLFSVVDEGRLRRILDKMLDPNEFLSAHGLRSVSKFHQDNPVSIELGGQNRTLDYEPGESLTYLFGGNSNWRGPVWFPVNYLVIEALQKFDFFYGEGFQVPSPNDPDKMLTLWDVATLLSRRLIHLFTRDHNGQRAVWGDSQKLQTDPNFRDNLQFFEYFHGETGKGLGAAHQTGWTALVAKLIQQSGEEKES